MAWPIPAHSKNKLTIKKLFVECDIRVLIVANLLYQLVVGQGVNQIGKKSLKLYTGFSFGVKSRPYLLRINDPSVVEVESDQVEQGQGRGELEVRGVAESKEIR